MSVAPGEVLYLPAGRWIRNVRWSSDDPHPTGYYSWIGLWHTIIGTSPESCCVCDRSVPSIIGGHVILGEGFKFWNEAANNNNSLEGSNRVFIAPICKGCNANDSGPLRVSQATDIVQLCGYQQNARFDFMQPKATPITGLVDNFDLSYVRNSHSSTNSVPSQPTAPSVPGWSTVTPRRSQVNITLRQSRLSGVARATFPDKQSHLVINYCIMF